MEAHNYHVDVAWSETRKGVMCSRDLSDRSQCFEVATPPEFPNGIPGIWSPEHLFTAAVSSCLMTTFLSIAENSKLDFISFKCPAVGKLEKTEEGFLMTEITLSPEVVVADESLKAKALRVLEKAEKHCLISNSIKSKVVMDPTIAVSESAKV